VIMLLEEEEGDVEDVEEMDLIEMALMTMCKSHL